MLDGIRLRAHTRCVTVLLAPVGIGVVILGIAALTLLLAAVGVGIVLLGAYVMLILPDTVGGTVRLPGGFQFSSPRAGLPLIGLGVAAIVIAATVTPEPTAEPLTTTTPDPPPLFEDNFSTPTERRWADDVDTEGTGGRYTDGTYHIVAEREMGGGGVLVSARTRPAQDVHLTVDAHRVEGTANSGYGYGLFCRADGRDNLYRFTIWAQHSVIEKRIDGQSTNLGTSNRFTAPQDDARKRLDAVCRTIRGGRAVRLELRVNDEVILSPTDDDSPHTSGGGFGMHVALGGGGNIGDTVEVEFDNFKAVGAE